MRQVARLTVLILGLSLVVPVRAAASSVTTLFGDMVLTGPTRERIVVNETAGVAFLVTDNGRRIAAVDYQQRRQVAELPMSEPVGAVEISGDGETLYLAGGRATSVREVDAATGTVLRSFDVTTVLGDGVVRDLRLAGPHLYLTMPGASHPLGRIHLSDGSVEALSDEDGFYLFWDGAGSMFIGVTNGGGHDLLKMDISQPGAPIVARAVDITCLIQRSTLVVGGSALVSGCGDVVDTTTLEVVGTVPAGRMASNRDGSKLYIGVVGADGKVDIERYDAATWTHETTFDGPCARGSGDRFVDDLHVVTGEDVLLATGRGWPGLCVNTSVRPTCMGLTATIVSESTAGGRVRGTAGSDVIVGLSGGEMVNGLGGDDVICTGDGNDGVRLQPGESIIDGGPGGDRVWGTAFTHGIHVDLSTGFADADGRHALIDIEHVNGSPHADTIIGDEGRNVLNGWGGDDWVDGGAGHDRIVAGDRAVARGGTGNDWLASGGGAPLLDGGPGHDYFTGGVVTFASSPRGVRVDLRAGTAKGYGQDTLERVTTVIGSEFDDIIKGDHEANQLLGLGGDDRIVGRGGPDLIEGGPGADDLAGNAGNDEINGGGQADMLRGGPDGDLVSGGPGDDIVWGQGGDDLVEGGGGSDEVRGHLGADHVIGGPGNDLLLGGDGHDLLIGETGDDTIDGGAGRDTVSHDGHPSGVVVSLRSGTAIGAGSDTLISIENAVGTEHEDEITGDASANHLIGGGGNDVIRGKAGDDVLDGGRGADDLFGGPGGDTCINGETHSQCEVLVQPAAHAILDRRMPLLPVTDAI